MNRHRWILLGLGALIVVSIGAIARLGDLGVRLRPMLLLWGAAHLAYAAAAWLVVRRTRAGSGLPIVLAVGLAARALLLPTAPTLSEDVYRYLWDGRLVAHGVNPYPHAPSEPALARFHGELLHHLNHADVPTIYPPAAQLLFGAVALVSATPTAWKLLLLSLESALVLALLRLLRGRGLPSDRLLLYYWNPLALVESFGSGHVDLVAASFLVAALALYEARRPSRAGVVFALAVLAKYVPGLLIPWFLRRRAWVLLASAAVTAAIVAAPFLAAGPALTTGLQIYARHWEFNGALYHGLREIIHSDLGIRRLFLGAGILATLAIAWKARSASGAAFASLVSFLLLSPTVFPWYLVPAVALLPLHPDWGMLAFSGLVALSYLPLPAYRDTGLWTLPGSILWVEYGGLIAVWSVAAVAALTRRSGGGRGALASGARVRVDEREHAHVEEPEQVEDEKR
ncbi:MAG TPA: glycosyltransferase 87 family protein [Candidatus Eisenbacteria bacterium]|nr:glycosyltransferase 87 family protein [Candidatus Eisenbacteria bacterium]